MQSIQDAIEAGTLDAEIAVVITDVPGTGILARAARHNLKGLWIDHAPFKTKLEGKADNEVFRVLREFNAFRATLQRNYFPTARMFVS